MTSPFISQIENFNALYFSVSLVVGFHVAIFVYILTYFRPQDTTKPKNTKTFVVNEVNNECRLCEKNSDQPLFCFLTCGFPTPTTLAHVPVSISHESGTLFVVVAFLELLFYSLYLFHGFNPVLLAFPLLYVPIYLFFQNARSAFSTSYFNVEFKLPNAIQSVPVTKISSSFDTERAEGAAYELNERRGNNGPVTKMYWAVVTGKDLLVIVGCGTVFFMVTEVLVEKALYFLAVGCFALAFVLFMFKEYYYRDYELSSFSTSTFQSILVKGDSYILVDLRLTRLFQSTLFLFVMFQSLVLYFEERNLYSFPVWLFLVPAGYVFAGVMYRITNKDGVLLKAYNIMFSLTLLASVYFLSLSFCDVTGVSCPAWHNWGAKMKTTVGKAVLYLLFPFFSVGMTALGLVQSFFSPSFVENKNL